MLTPLVAQCVALFGLTGANGMCAGGNQRQSLDAVRGKAGNLDRHARPMEWPSRAKRSGASASNFSAMVTSDETAPSRSRRAQTEKRRIARQRPESQIRPGTSSKGRFSDIVTRIFLVHEKFIYTKLSVGAREYFHVAHISF
jgi:hypothetical protein